MVDRRSLLKVVGALGITVLVPLDKLVRLLPSIPEADSPHGELYEGFVLLEKDAPIPSFVSRAPCPILGELAPTDQNDPVVLAHRAETSYFDSVERLRSNVGFPMFIPDLLPPGAIPLSEYVIRFAGSGEVWEARVDFGLEGSREPLVSLAACPVFSRPYPVWPVTMWPQKEADEMISDEEYVVVKPQKVAFTPRPGIMLPTARGHMLQWIKRDVLYAMVIEYDGRRETAEEIGKSLTEK